MSFALEYRKKLQQQQQEAYARAKANEGYVSPPLDERAETGKNRRRVFLALVVAGGVLGVFNSGGLVQYSYDLAEMPFGPRLIVLSEKWHGLMQEQKATRVVEQIRDTVMLARQSRWRDLREGLGLEKPARPLDGQENPVVPAATDPEPGEQELEKPKMAKPEGPVMRASADMAGAGTR